MEKKRTAIGKEFMHILLNYFIDAHNPSGMRQWVTCAADLWLKSLIDSRSAYYSSSFFKDQKKTGRSSNSARRTRGKLTFYKLAFSS